jgi:uncharacterized protein
LNQLVAREVVNFREKHGAFTSRSQLQEVPGLGEKRFTQAAGFLKISDGTDPLDATWIHPESYGVARQVLADLGFAPVDLRDRAKLEEIRGKLATLNPAEVAAKLGAGEPTIRDIFDALARPGRDPREDLPPPIFKKGVLKLEDITPGMELKGTVLNVVPFGAFVDIGLKESGLVHISQMANRYIKSPYDVVSVGDVITVWVMEVKPGEKKISLSMIAPGQERRPTGRFPGGQGHGAAPRSDRGSVGSHAQPPVERPPQSARPERGSFQGGQERPGGGYQARGQGGPRFGGRGPGGPGGGRGHGGPRPGSVPAGQPPVPPATGGSPGNAAEAAATPAPQATPPTPPPKPKPQGKPKPLPNLTTDKKAGKVPLNTFGELLAFFKKDEPKPEPPSTGPAETEGKPEEPKADQPPS